MKHYLGDKRAIFLFVFPALSVFTIMVFYPICVTVFRSFTQWDGLRPSTFVFLDNYKQIFLDEIFYTSFLNGILVAVVLVVFQIGLGTVLAVAVADKDIWGAGFLRKTYFIPVVLSATTACQLFINIYNAQFGLINKIFEALGLSYRQDWLSNPAIAIYFIAFVNAWQYLGYQFALLYAGIKAIPQDYYEAARIDGASKLQANLRITFPLLRETYKLCFIFSITGGFSTFAQMKIMTNGGPGTATYTMTLFLFRSAFQLSQFGYGCAIAILLVLQCLLATVVINRLLAREIVTY
jgi:raffinose/stachyose/melibiose transport system permease protein